MTSFFFDLLLLLLCLSPFISFLPAFINVRIIGFQIEIPFTAPYNYQAEYPILSAEAAEGEALFSFNCYGWGTAQMFEGASFALISPSGSYYAFYDIAGNLSEYANLDTGCSYNANDQLIDGEEPEGSFSPAVHSIP